MRKIISMLMAVLLVFSMVTAVSAAQSVTIAPIDVDLLTKTVTITGTGTAGKSFVLVVTNPGAELTDAVAATVQNVREVKVDANGYFTYKFELYEAKDSTTDKPYKVYVDGVEKATFNYKAGSIAADTQTIVDAARAGDVSTLAAKLSDTVVTENFSIDNYEPLVSEEVALNMDVYTAKLLGAVKAADEAGKFAGTDAENGAVLQYIIKNVAALELFNQGKAAELSFNADGSFKYESALKVSEIDKNGITAYEYYTDGVVKNKKTYTLSAEGKKQVQDALVGKNFANEEEFYDAFIKAVVCAGVNKSTEKGSSGYTGYAHVTALLTAENKAKAGVSDTTISGYIAQNLAAYKPEIASVEALNTLIATYKKAEGDNASGGGITGSNSGGVGGANASGISSNGTAVIPPVVENTDAVIQNDKNAAETYKHKFDDIAGSEWAVEAVEYLYTKGVVNGKADRVFDPNGTVTREEIVKMISIAMGLTEEAEISFADVEGSSWAKPFIAKAVKAGIISGISETEFGFGKPVTRQDIATMLYRVIGAKENVVENEFADKTAIADYAKDAVSVLAEMKVINGFEDKTFKPEASCTRAQAAVIIYNYLKTSGLAN